MSRRWVASHHPGGKPIARLDDVCSRGNFSGWKEQRKEAEGEEGGAEKFVNRVCEMFPTRLNNV